MFRKRFIALVMALTMLFTLMAPAFTFALDDGETPDQTTHSETGEQLPGDGAGEGGGDQLSGNDGEGGDDQLPGNANQGGNDADKGIDDADKGEGDANNTRGDEGSEGTFAVIVAEGIQHGTVTADKTEAKAGETVTLAVTPKEGYATVEVQIKNGEEITSIYPEDAAYSFTMPDHPVTVTAIFYPYYYTVETVVQPEDAGTIEAVGGVSDGEAACDSTVELTVTPAEGFALESLTAVNDTTEQPLELAGNSFTMPASNVTVTAVFATTIVTVTFKKGLDDLEPYCTVIVDKGEVIPVDNRPEDPEPENSDVTFGGWYIDDPETIIYLSTKTFNEDTTLFAQWNAVPTPSVALLNDGLGYATFAAAAAARTSNDDVITLLANITDAYTLAVGEPNEILKVQHNDKTLTVKAPEGYALKNDTVGGVTTYTIAAIYTVTFNANGGSEVEAQQVEDGKTATQPTDPTKEHYTFQGWFSDEELTTAFAFDTPITANVTLYAKWVEAPYFKGHGLALGDAINVRFNLALPGGKDLYKGSYVEFFIENATGTKRYVTADAVQVANDPDNDNPRYRYVCPVNAIQMADMITPVFHYTVGGEERTVQGTPYAAKTYIDNHKDEAEDEYRNAVRATGNYGHFAQLYLHDVHQDTYGTHAEMPLYGSGSYDYNAIYGSLADLEIVRPVVGDMEAISYLLYCDSQTGIWLYLRLKAGYSGPTPTATYNGTTVDMSLNTADGRYRYKIPGSMASELDQMKNVTLTIGADSTVVKVSVLSWVRGSLDSNYNGSANEKDFASSLYWYWKAADDYLAAHH